MKDILFAKPPKISIITPSLNQAKFINRTFQSICDQNYPNLEYIIIDGMSTDGTQDLLKKYAKYFYWVSELDHGQADAINKGIKRATGDVITFINSDDYYLPGALNHVAEVFTKYPDTQWLTGNYTIVNQDGNPIQRMVVEYKKFYRRYSRLALLKFTNYIIQPSTFWRRSIHDEIGYFDDTLRYCFDYDFWIRLMMKYRIHCIDQPLSAFRIHSKSKGGSEYMKQFKEELDVLRRYNTNKLTYFLHSVHNKIIVSTYRLIK